MDTIRSVYLLTRRNGITEAYVTRESAEYARDIDEVMTGVSSPLQKVWLYR